MEKSDKVSLLKEPQFNISYARNVYTNKLLLLRDWQLFEQEQGCIAFEIDGICLRMDKSPPPLPDDQVDKHAVVLADIPSPAPAPAPEPSAPPPAEKGLVAQFFDWVFDEQACDEEQERLWREKKIRAVKPFDLYDIPSAMRMEGFYVGEKLAQRWLDGRAYSAYIKQADGNEIEGRYDDDLSQ